MKINRIVSLLWFLFLISGCADYKSKQTTQKDLKQYYSSSGFALVYNENLYEKKIVNKKLNNEDLLVMHSLLKRNTPIKIINPDNSKILETKIYKNAIYPNIFNVVISEKVASELGLDLDNPIIYVKSIENLLVADGDNGAVCPVHLISPAQNYMLLFQAFNTGIIMEQNSQTITFENYVLFSGWESISGTLQIAVTAQFPN